MNQRKLAENTLLVFHIIIEVIVISLLIVFSFVWNINNIEKQTLSLASAEAKANWNKDQAFRRWATRHGGLYVKPDERTPPNPYLAHLANRDVITTDGTKLTLMNPAYMMNQMTKEFEKDYGIKGNITGKILLNPLNKADPWELDALNQFEKGTKEVLENTTIDNEPFVRFMRPIIMQKGCVSCHGHLGFKVGDIRGGVSISIPLTPYIEAAKESKQSVLYTHILVWLVGLVVAALLSWRSKQHKSRLEQLNKALTLAHDSLEERVKKRTSELEISKKTLAEIIRELDFQKLALDIHAIVSITDVRGNITYCNDKFCDISGYTREELIGQNHRILKSSEHSQAFYGNLWKTIANGKVWRGEIKNLKKGGGYYWVDASIIPFLDDKQKPFQYVAIRTDITSRIEAELNAKNETIKADKANQAKSEFLSSMSHELRTPLNAILGFGQMLDLDTKEPLSRNQKESVDQIMEGGQHLLKLINEILDLAKIEAGKVELLIEDINPIKAIDESLTMLSSMAEKRGIRISISAMNKENLLIRADYTRLKQIFLNLISNAIKYNRENGTISIDFKKTTQNRLRIIITDTGKGIPDTKKSQVFKSFNRLGAEGSDIEGTGIGLVICKSFLALMNGNIGFDSEEDQGSSFWFELPIITNQPTTDYKIEYLSKTNGIPNIQKPVR